MFTAPLSLYISQLSSSNYYWNQTTGVISSIKDQLTNPVYLMSTSVRSDQDEQPQKSPQYTQFDDLAFNMLTYLETFDEVCDIEFVSHDGLQSVEFNIWERKNNPIELPWDMKGFYELFNGFVLRWKVLYIDQEITVGEIKLNKIENIASIPMQGHFMPADVSGLKILPPDLKSSVAFSFASSEEGQVVLLYRNSTEPNGTGGRDRGFDDEVKDKGSNHAPPEIWFIDCSCRWHFVCFTFTQYLRLCIMHLGIQGWHMIFTPEGITMNTRQWMGMFCKERLCVYQHAISSGSA